LQSRDNATGRKAAIIIAVILGIFAALYLGGLLSQLSAGYQTWLGQDGLTGNAAMPIVNFSPLRCILYALSTDGIKTTLSVIAAAVGIFLYVKLHARFGQGDYDRERNFRRAKEGTYGTAAWMSDREMKQALEVTTPENAKGTILGEKNGKVVCLPVDTKLNKHITAEMFRQNGYQVKVFNLINPEHSDSWNCMANLAGDTLTTQILTDVIISNTSKGKIDHFWDNGKGNLLKALILYVD
jgi:type IV secretion system protein VirD4